MYHIPGTEKDSRKAAPYKSNSPTTLRFRSPADGAGSVHSKEDSEENSDKGSTANDLMRFEDNGGVGATRLACVGRTDAVRLRTQPRGPYVSKQRRDLLDWRRCSRAAATSFAKRAAPILHICVGAVLDCHLESSSVLWKDTQAHIPTSDALGGGCVGG